MKNEIKYFGLKTSRWDRKYEKVGKSIFASLVEDKEDMSQLKLEFNLISDYLLDVYKTLSTIEKLAAAFFFL